MVEMKINGFHTNEAVVTILDDEDYEIFCRWKWQESKAGYARRNRQVVDEDGTKRWQTVQLHRAVLGLVGTDTPDSCVDHINGNRLDNRKENLRIVSLSENAYNRHVSLSSTGVLCVSQYGNSYIARARRNCEGLYLGSYKTPKEARQAVEMFDRNGIKPQIRQQRRVMQLTQDGVTLNVFDNCATAYHETGVCRENISRCANGRRKTAGGFVWRYV